MFHLRGVLRPDTGLNNVMTPSAQFPILNANILFRSCISDVLPSVMFYPRLSQVVGYESGVKYHSKGKSKSL